MQLSLLLIVEFLFGFFFFHLKMLYLLLESTVGLSFYSFCHGDFSQHQVMKSAFSDNFRVSKSLRKKNCRSEGSFPLCQ